MKLIRQRSISESFQDSDFDDEIHFRIFNARGVTTKSETEYSLKRLLPPEQIKNLAEAADIVVEHINAGNSIVIFGDYDADGATSSALCIRALTELAAANIRFVIPDRVSDGYGLSIESAQNLIDLNPSLIITVDNGIASMEGIQMLRDANIDVVVTDHHLASENLPNANAIVNQNAFDDCIEGKNLSGVGIAFYLMLAIRKKLREIGWFDDTKPEPNLANCLDLVAIGTVADLVPLDYQNRLLVNEGLKRIRQGVCSEGIKALVQVSGKELNELSSTDIAFHIAPRINAAGRLDNMQTGVLCLLSQDIGEAQLLASELDEINKARKDLQKLMTEEAEQQLSELDPDLNNTDYATVLFNDSWHEGVIGIVAARVREMTHRPSIIFAQSEQGAYKGSGRSISGIHLRDMLDAVDKTHPGLILKFGGHAMAAGLTIKPEKLNDFKQSLNQVMQERVDASCFDPVISCDGDLPSRCFQLSWIKSLNAITPWGQKFPQPSFTGEFNVLNQRVLSDRHIKWQLEVKDDATQQKISVDAIAFNQPADVLNVEHETVEIHFELDVNRFRQQENLQLIVKDVL